MAKMQKEKQAEEAAEDEDEGDLHCFDASEFARIRTNADSTETRVHIFFCIYFPASEGRQLGAVALSRTP